MDALEEQKKVSARKRLWGAAVLIALLVIFLPLLLDGSGSESQFRRVERLRAEPPRIIDENGLPESMNDDLVDASGRLINTRAQQGAQVTLGAEGAQELQNAQGSTRVQDAQGSQATQGAQGLQETLGTQSAQDRQAAQANQGTVGDRDALSRAQQDAQRDAQNQQGVQVSQVTAGQRNAQGAQSSLLAEAAQGATNAPSNEGLPSDQAASIARDDASSDTASDTRTSTTGAASSDTENLSAWVIQAGSFADEKNALAVRDRLRRAGYPSFVTPTETAPPVYRVRVGPMIDLALANENRDKVMNYLGREAIVVSYP